MSAEVTFSLIVGFNLLSQLRAPVEQQGTAAQPAGPDHSNNRSRTLQLLAINALAPTSKWQPTLCLPRLRILAPCR